MACAPQVVKETAVVTEEREVTRVVEKEVTAEPREREVVLNVWLESEGADATFDQEILDTFNRRRKGHIKVEPRMIPDAEWFTALRVGVTGGTPPDLFTNEGGSQLKELIDADAVLPLDEWWERNQDDYVKGSQGDNYFYGKLYSVTYRFPGVRDLLAWNVDILEEHGIEPPTTCDEWMASMETLKGKGVVPFAIGNKRGWPGGHLWQTMHIRVGGSERQLKAMDREDVHWTEPDFIKAAKLYTELGKRELLSPGYMADDFAPGVAYFQGGNAAFFHPFSSQVFEWGAPTEEFNYGWGRFPQIPPMMHGHPWDSFIYGSGGYGISSKTEYLNETFELFDYLLSVEVLKARKARTDFATVRKGVVTEEEKSEETRRFEELVASAKDRIPYIVLRMDPAVGRQVFDVGALAVWTGQQTPEEWMQKMEEAHAKLTGTEAVLNP